ncbi:hypothetical protein JOM56_008259 [Amanita muscaria]
MPFSSLPHELVAHIVRYLSKHHVAVLATTNHLFASLAQQLLYRDLYVSSSSHTLAVVVTLAKKPSVAVHVRAFAIQIDPSSVLFKSFYDALRTALSNMTGLTSLRLFVDAKFSSALRPVPSTFSNLLNVSTSLVYDDNIALCLAKAKSILEVDFDSPMDTSPDSPDLPAGALPLLRSFTGPVRVAEVMVPGRPVEFIRLNTGTILENVAVKLAQSTAPVTLFEANVDSLSISSLLSLSQTMPHLRYVRFTTTSNSVEPPSHQFCDDVAEVLTFFPELESFELWGIHFEQIQKAPKSHGHIWKAKIFCPVDSSESNQQAPSPDLFSEEFMRYQ